MSTMPIFFEESPESQIVRLTAALCEYCAEEYQMSGEETARGILILAGQERPRGKRGWVNVLEGIDGDEVASAIEAAEYGADQ